MVIKSPPHPKKKKERERERKKKKERKKEIEKNRREEGEKMIRKHEPARGDALGRLLIVVWKMSNCHVTSDEIMNGRLNVRLFSTRRGSVSADLLNRSLSNTSISFPDKLIRTSECWTGLATAPSSFPASAAASIRPRVPGEDSIQPESKWRRGWHRCYLSIYLFWLVKPIELVSLLLITIE